MSTLLLFAAPPTGLGSVSGLSHPAATVEDLDFKDNSYNSDQDFQMNMENNAYLPPLGKDCLFTLR